MQVPSRWRAVLRHLALSLFAFAALTRPPVASAQPASTGLGTLPVGTTNAPVTIGAPNQVRWFSFNIPVAADNALGSYLDIYAAAGSINDPEIGLYTSTGSFVATDDDSGNASDSQLSFGLVAPTRSPVGNGIPFGGQAGTLAAGTYYLAVAHFNSTFGPNGWAATSTATATGTFNLSFNYSIGGSPTPPSGVGSITPANALPGSTVVVQVTVTPGTFPVSTGLAVSANLSSLDGPTNFTLLDNGVAPDAAAGDNVFTAAFEIPCVRMPGGASIGFTVSDAQSRSNGGVIAAIVDEAGDGIGAGFARGDGRGKSLIEGFLAADDVDAWIINITNPAQFVASTVGGATFDTQLFLFNMAGVGIAMNDDDAPSASVQSRIDGSFVPAPGNYILAITRYNRDPVDSFSASIWNNTPFNTIRAPDGPGAANPLAGWTGSTAPGSYAIAISGGDPAPRPLCMSMWLGFDEGVCPTNRCNPGETWNYIQGDASTAADDMPNGKLSGSGVSVVTSSSQVGGSVKFANPGGAIEVVNTNNSFKALNIFSGTSMTLMAWIRPSGTAAGTIANKPGAFKLALDTSNKPVLTLAASTNLVLQPSTVTALPSNVWSHLAVRVTVSSGTTASVDFYVNGVPTSASGTWTALQPANSLFIGADNASATNGFRGQLDEVQIYQGDCVNDSVVKSIVAAGSLGVSRVGVNAPWDDSVKTSNNSALQLSVSRQKKGSGTYSLRVESLSPTLSFAPIGGNILVPSLGTTTATVQATTSPALVGFACYRTIATELATGIEASDFGSLVRSPAWYATPTPATMANAPIGSTVAGNFRVTRRAAAGSPSTLLYRISAMPSDMSMVVSPVSLNGNPVGTPLTGSLTIAAAAGSFNVIPFTATMLNSPNVTGVHEVLLTIDWNQNGILEASDDLQSISLRIPVAPECGGVSVCVADFDDGTATGTPDGGVGIEDLIYYAGLYDAGSCGADVDNGSGSGEPDGGVGIEDLLYYLFRYDAGC